MIAFDEKQLEKELVEIYKDIHRHPEPGYKENRTSGLVAEYLEGLDLEVRKNVALTGVIGTLDSGRPGKTIMIRADMDCLPIEEATSLDYKSENRGYMHACGHDAHVAMLLGAAKILSEHKEQFTGKIKFLFQPAEEGIDPSMEETVRKSGYEGVGGAGYMIQEGALDDVSACLIIHVNPSIPTGCIEIPIKNACASSDYFKITVTGHGGHGAFPYLAIDPVPVACQLVNAIHLLPAREVKAQETCVISIGTLETPNSVWNAVANEVILTGGFRTFNEEVRDTLRARIMQLAEDTAKAGRCTARVDNLKGYGPCVNSERISSIVYRGCVELLGAEHAILKDAPDMASEDGGAYLAKVPGALMRLGVGVPDKKCFLHNPSFEMNLNALIIGTKVHINNAIVLLRELNK